MNEEKQRIAIAEACGITEIVRKNRHEYGGLIGRFPDGEVRIIPSYCRDLNAMREARKILTPMQKATYARILTSTTWDSEQPTYCAMDATAAQEAEAFLRTIERWEEEP
jgi:hypothetical protein